MIVLNDLIVLLKMQKNGEQMITVETKFSCGKENSIMKSLFERARNIRHGCLESRLVARMETEGRKLTDEETANELEYLAETIPYAGLGKEYEKEIMAAIRYLRKYY